MTGNGNAPKQQLAQSDADAVDAGLAGAAISGEALRRSPSGCAPSSAGGWPSIRKLTLNRRCPSSGKVSVEAVETTPGWPVSRAFSRSWKPRIRSLLV